MRIPKSFNLAGITVKVKYNRDLLHKENNYGEARFRQNLIYLQPSTKASPLEEDNVNQTFLHEKMHFILHVMGEYDLCNNEKFVDMFAHLFYQSIESEKF